MKQELALRVLGQVMNWDETRSREEFGWLRVISRYKYDGYRGFLAGARFVENLVCWLQQFDPAERGKAYEFVRRRLVYIGSAEMEHLVELVYPEIVQRRLLRAVAEQLRIPIYRVWAQHDANDAYRELRRKTLFLGLSDGARIDVFRRANAGAISNEQVVVATEINKQKWNSLLGDLRSELGQDARFRFVVLLDDFTASGTTLLRKENDQWKGKLKKFWDQSQGVTATHFEDDWVLCVHHYIGTHQAQETIIERDMQARKELEGWFENVEFTFGTVLSDNLRVNGENAAEFMDLINRYYNPAIETHHFEVGGSADVRHGFGQCALPVVLEHNTPNNSVALLWATADTSDEHPEMRPLFERTQRHV